MPNRCEDAVRQWRVLPLAALIVILLAPSCSSSLPAGGDQGLLLEIARVSGGDAPVPEVVRIFADGRLELEPFIVGRPGVLVGRAKKGVVSRIAALVRSDGFRKLAQGLAAAGRPCCDMPTVEVSSPELHFIISLDEVPREAKTLLLLVDELCEAAFHDDYTQLLAPPDGSVPSPL